jgi:hypothetical protein
VIADDESLLHRLPDARAEVLVSCGDLPDDIILSTWLAPVRATCSTDTSIDR